MLHDGVPPTPAGRKLASIGGHSQRLLINFKCVMSEHSAASSVSSSTKVSDKVSDKGTPKMHAKFAVRFSVGRVYKEGRTMRDDCELLRQYAEAGSEDAFAELVHRHLPLVYSAALRQAHGDGTAAEDIAQTVFVDLARKAGSLSGRLRLASWLYTSTRFASAKVLRGEQRRRLRESAAAEMQEPACQSGTERAWVELSPVLDEAMSLLDPGERDVILLRFFEGRQLKEVGAALGLSEDAARMRVNRALETLRSVLASRGVTPSAAALATVLSCEGGKAGPAGLASRISGSALRGGAAGLGTVVGLARLLTASKLKVGILGTVLAVAVAIPVLSNRQTQPEPPRAVVAPAQGAERDKNGLPSPGTAVRVQEVAREMLPTRARPGRPPGAIPALPVIPSRPVAVAGPPNDRRAVRRGTATQGCAAACRSGYSEPGGAASHGAGAAAQFHHCTRVAVRLRGQDAGARLRATPWDAVRGGFSSGAAGTEACGPSAGDQHRLWLPDSGFVAACASRVHG